MVNEFETGEMYIVDGDKRAFIGGGEGYDHKFVDMESRYFMVVYPKSHDEILSVDGNMVTTSNPGSCFVRSGHAVCSLEREAFNEDFHKISDETQEALLQ
jgi:hypothetical protein|tara:strand:- start:326 stop:625 length:300 start_codon:yes stop_codon:yes gene_type:complete